MHGQVFQLVEDHEAEHESEDADAEAAHQQRSAIHALKADRRRDRAAPGWLHRRREWSSPAGAAVGVRAPAAPPARQEPHRDQPQDRTAARIPARATRGQNVSDMSLLLLPEGLRPSDSPTRALARRFAGSLRSRGSRRFARSRLVSRRLASPSHQSISRTRRTLDEGGPFASLRSLASCFAPLCLAVAPVHLTVRRRVAHSSASDPRPAGIGAARKSFKSYSKCSGLIQAG